MALTQVTADGVKDDAVSAGKIPDDAISLAHLAAGTDGQVITYDASGNPVAVGPGTDGQVLTSTGAGSPPAFEDAGASVGGATGVDFNDSVNVRFGTDNDMQIKHNGTDASIANNTGNLYIQTADSSITMQLNNGEKLVKAIADGAVELYYDNAKKFETSSYGVWLGDNSRVTLGNTAGSPDCHFYHDASNTNIQNITGDLIIKSNSDGDKAIVVKNGAGVELYYDNVKKFETQNTGCKVGGNLTVDGDILPNSTNSDDLGTSSLRFQECHSAYWIHRYGSSGGVGQNEAEAIYIAGGVHFFGDYITMSNSNFSNGICGNRSYPLVALHQDGSGAALHAEDGAITEASDYRIKENVSTLGSGIDKVKALKPITYTLKKSWKPSGNGEVYHGFIAHEVGETLSGITGIVCGEKDAMAPELYSIKDEEEGKIPAGKKVMDETGNMTTDMMIQSVDYGKLTPILTAALKEAIAKIEVLETKVAALEAG